MQSAGAYTIEVFQYPAGPDPLSSGWEQILGAPDFAPSRLGREESAPAPAAPCTANEQDRAHHESLLAEESRRSFETGRAQGFDQGRMQEREQFNQMEQRRQAQVAGWFHQFDHDRQHYFQSVEHEVVELALGIAARILRREAQMDPLLLTGAVRVALGQLSSTTEARLRVPESDLALWTETMTHLPNLAVKPVLVGVPQMHTGDCTLETNLGSIDLGLRAQLGEIERGFCDKASPRPAEEPKIDAAAETSRSAV
jgi:flagellar assembly protein FliH